MPEFLTRNEIARLLGISENAVYTLFKSGRLPVVRVGRILALPAGEIEVVRHRLAVEGVIPPVASPEAARC